MRLKVSAHRVLGMLLLVLGLLAVSCTAPATVTPIPSRAAPTAEPTQEPTVEPTPTETVLPEATETTPVNPTPTEAEPDTETPDPEAVQSRAVQAAIEQLAEELGVDPADVTVHSANRAEWPNGCLGLAGPDEFCTQAIVPGWGGMLVVDDQQFEFRTDEEGNVVRFVPGAALAARQVLAQQLQLELDAVRFVAIEPVEWPDACLGVASEDEACADVIVPGYRVVLQAEGEEYEFHTDNTGGDVRLASTPEAEIKSPLLRWTQDGERCESAAMDAEDVTFGPCEGPRMRVSVPLHRQEQLAELANTFRPFAADTPAGSLEFIGNGTERATPAEQRMLAEWARLVVQEAAAGRSGASWGLAIGWHREGGIAGFCDDLTVYVTGEVFASSCRDQQPEDLGRGWLSADALGQLYTWVDTFSPSEEEQVDDATADAMTVRLVFSGAGAESASDADIAEIQEWAAELYSSLD